MESKFYVSLEAARLLKEKGYNEVTKAAWCGIFGEMKIAPQIGGYRNSDYSDDIKLYSAPTKSEAIDWLESKGVIVEIQYYQESSTWSYAIYCICYMSSDEEFQTRLEAEEAAIIKALELL